MDGYDAGMRTIGARELRNDSAKILRELQQGEEFEVTVKGEPVGVLLMRPVPVRPQRLVPAESARDMFEGLIPLARTDLDEWKRDIREAYDDEVEDPHERVERLRRI